MATKSMQCLFYRGHHEIPLAGTQVPLTDIRAQKVVIDIVRSAAEPGPAIRAARIQFVEAPRRSCAPQSFAANTISAGGFLGSCDQLRCWREATDSHLIGNPFEFTMNFRNSSCIGGKIEL
jgi:hypothetical protein